MFEMFHHMPIYNSSRIFDVMQVRDISLYLEGSDFFPFLKTPHTFVDFHLPGTVPLLVVSWKILSSIGEISAACSFRNHGGMASGPEALLVFNSDNCFATSLVVIERLSMACILP